MPLNPVLNGPRWFTVRRPALATIISVLVLSCASDHTSLPAVKQAPGRHEPTQVCVEVPPPPPILIGERRNAGECAPASYRHGLPLEVTVVQGRVASFRFHPPCGGDDYVVSPEVEACVRQVVSHWRYMVLQPRCADQTSAYFDGMTEDVFLVPKDLNTGGMVPGAVGCE